LSLLSAVFGFSWGREPLRHAAALICTKLTLLFFFHAIRRVPDPALALAGGRYEASSDRLREKKEKHIMTSLQEEKLAATDFSSPAMIAHVSQLLMQSNATHKKKDLNLDSALSITSNVRSFLPKVHRAVAALMGQDLYRAPAEVKLFVLKVRSW
jgi:hypothetical protein